MGKVIHIVFSESAEVIFKYAINREKSIVGDKVISFYDNLSNGVIDNPINIDDRVNLLKERNEQYSYIHNNDIDKLKENYDKLYNKISKINDNDTIYLWYGQYDKEICGMIYVLHLLKDKSVNIYTVDVSDIIVRYSKSIILVKSPGGIAPENLDKYMKDARKIDSVEYQNSLNQWEILTKEKSVLRTYRNGKVESVSEDYFDKDILKFTDREYIKSIVVVGNIISNSEIGITDDYIFWRIIQLVNSGKINFKGNFGVIGEMDICISDEGLSYLSKYPKEMEYWNKIKQDLEKSKKFIDDIKNQGRMEERISIAKKLLDVLDIETIAEKTELTIDQIKNFYK
ncbi:protein of unknown function DUF1835 [Gottschalkia purinilytica]|uniref:DUF1835 domain-containing protein n=1 Tax=Gottschalkia purinilytica TaxID=1503 RepID=A0A0L0WFF1_GOTPU|nr:DUF1835 domain-containing protein [Gottschalkia purinilytica]KNF10208.1 protein of unknown function DUF1835 [Gottschalkia purinilytica]